MTEIAALEAEKKAILDEIASLQAEIGRQAPGRKLPSPASARISTLTLKLNTLNMKLSRAQKSALG